MKIACLGWGSLVWNPGALPLRSQWHSDGPPIRVEFVRQSGGDTGRITLFILPSAKQVTSLWVEIDSDDPEATKELLRIREGKSHRRHIGLWREGDPDPGSLPGLTGWAAAQCRDLDRPAAEIPGRGWSHSIRGRGRVISAGATRRA